MWEPKTPVEIQEGVSKQEATKVHVGFHQEHDWYVKDVQQCDSHFTKAILDLCL